MGPEIGMLVTGRDGEVIGLASGVVVRDGIRSTIVPMSEVGMVSVWAGEDNH